MRTDVDELFREEAQRFRLRHTCGYCVHYACESRSCGLGFPVEPHEVVDLNDAKHLHFCKSFELW